MPKKESSPLLVVDRDFLPIMLDLIGHARESIDLMAFSFAIGSAGGKIDFKGAPYRVAAKLAERKRKNPDLKIRMFIEGIRETESRNRVTAAFLKKSGVTVRFGSTHAKGICVDQRYFLFGSTNLTNQSILKNNETNLLIDSPAVATSFGLYFDYLWRGGKHGGITLPAPLLADGDFKPALLDMITSAKKTIDFSIYFFDQADIENALIEAHQRGVKIVGFVHQHRAFALSYVRRTARTVQRLRAAGIKTIHFAPATLFTHSKFLVRDKQELALGTGNWLNEDVNIHPQLYIRLIDAPLSRHLTKHLTRQIRLQGTGD
jgi:phosphatidylserine/phosphatidylglycerophosphate/cardiolipin synthase-like enzyme